MAFASLFDIAGPDEPGRCDLVEAAATLIVYRNLIKKEADITAQVKGHSYAEAH